MTEMEKVTAAAEAAAERAVQKMLLLIGIDISKPVEAQETFSTLRDVARTARDPEFRHDLEHLRSWRRFWEKVCDKGALAAVGILVAAACAALWAGFRDMLK
jgi:hypothetical protein